MIIIHARRNKQKNTQAHWDASLDKPVRAPKRVATRSRAATQRKGISWLCCRHRCCGMWIMHACASASSVDLSPVCGLRAGNAILSVQQCSLKYCIKMRAFLQLNCRRGRTMRWTRNHGSIWMTMSHFFETEQRDRALCAQSQVKTVNQPTEHISKTASLKPQTKMNSEATTTTTTTTTTPHRLWWSIALGALAHKHTHCVYNFGRRRRRHRRCQRDNFTFSHKRSQNATRAIRTHAARSNRRVGHGVASVTHAI